MDFLETRLATLTGRCTSFVNIKSAIYFENDTDAKNVANLVSKKNPTIDTVICVHKRGKHVHLT